MPLRQLLLLCFAEHEHCPQLFYRIWEQLLPVDTSVAYASGRCVELHTLTAM